MHHTGRPIIIGAVALAAAGLLAGCSSGGSPDATATATATATRTVTATPTTTGSPTPSSMPSASGGSGGTAGTGGAATGRCATSDLTGSIEAGSGGAAGSVDVHLVLTNTGSTTCTLQGWPGVTPDGFRVYPPGSKQSLFVKDTDYQACGNTSATLLAVQALVPAGQATS